MQTFKEQVKETYPCESKAEGCRSEKLFLIPRFLGACHTDELPYLFTGAFRDWKEQASAADLAVIEHMTQLWAQFAKDGYEFLSESKF
jgi:carboxylesterase type B